MRRLSRLSQETPQQSAHSSLDDPDQTDTVPSSQSASPLFDQPAAREGVANPQEEQFQPQRDGTDHEAAEEEPQAHSTTAAAVQPPAGVVDDEERRDDEAGFVMLSNEAYLNALSERALQEEALKESREDEKRLDELKKELGLD